jgi:hypothetical protein
MNDWRPAGCRPGNASRLSAELHPCPRHLRSSVDRDLETSFHHLHTFFHNLTLSALSALTLVKTLHTSSVDRCRNNTLPYARTVLESARAATYSLPRPSRIPHSLASPIMFQPFHRRAKTAPSHYPRVPFHLLRFFQLFASLVVGGIMSFFMWHLTHDHWQTPWTFVLVII